MTLPDKVAFLDRDGDSFVSLCEFVDHKLQKFVFVDKCKPDRGNYPPFCGWKTGGLYQILSGTLSNTEKIE